MSLALDHRAGALVVLLALVPACGTPLGSRDRGGATVRADLAARLQALATALDPGMRLGMEVTDARSGHQVVSLNAAQRLVPASTLKLLTGAAALAQLTPGHRFTTELLADAEPDAGGALDTLYVRGSGDPSTPREAFTVMAAALEQRGITAVRDMVVDDTAFDATRWGHAWAWDDRNDDYSAPVDALNLAGNVVTLTLTPGAVEGMPAQVVVSPSTGYVTVVAKLTTLAPEALAAVDLAGLSPDSAGLAQGSTLVLSGGLPQDSAPLVRRFAVQDGAQFAAAALQDALHAQRIDVRGQASRGSVPPAALLLARHTSPMLACQLADAMKASDNHAMECLIKRMGMLSQDRTGSWEAGLHALRTFLVGTVGLDAAATALVDGSGLSRKNLVSPHDLVTLLTHAHRDVSWGPVFLASLPVAGVDGTLTTRFLGSSLLGRVRAKTGTMGGVSSLAGVMTTQGGDTLIFAIMMNNYMGSAETLRRLQEDMLCMLDAG